MTIESGPTERESFEADSPRSIKEAVENIDRLSDEAAISLAEELLSAFDREVLKVEGDNEQVKFELKKRAARLPKFLRFGADSLAVGRPAAEIAEAAETDLSQEGEHYQALLAEVHLVFEETVRQMKLLVDSRSRQKAVLAANIRARAGYQRGFRKKRIRLDNCCRQLAELLISRGGRDQQRMRL